MNSSVKFAVVDVETTGLFPRVDRIVEIAIFLVSSSNEIIKEFCTLINPQRDIGPTHIHGITARDVKNAPTFEEIAGNVLSFFPHAFFVSHNVAFDMRFLEKELERLGYNFPELPSLDTMWLSRIADPCIPSRNLEEICRYFNIKLSHHHCAYEDGLATVKLLMQCIKTLNIRNEEELYKIGVYGDLISENDLPRLPKSGKLFLRKDAAQEINSEYSYITKVVDRLPVSSDRTCKLDRYFDFLDKILQDRRITCEESENLFTLAKDLGISHEKAVNLHKIYLCDLIRIALKDNIITKSEQNDINEVRKLLGISSSEYEEIFEIAKMQIENPISVIKYPFENIKGKSICFTGELNYFINGEPTTRLFAMKLAEQKGMIVKKGVVKGLDYLVASDSDTMSEKAMKARKYGISIIAPSVFWQMMEVQVDN